MSDGIIALIVDYALLSAVTWSLLPNDWREVLLSSFLLDKKARLLASIPKATAREVER